MTKLNPLEQLQKGLKAIGDYENRPWHAIYRSGGRGAPQYIQIDLHATFPSHLLIAPRSFSYRMALRMGLSLALITGDDRFDQQFLVEADDRAVAAQLLQNATLRQTLLLLFETGVRQFQFTPQAIIATLPDIQPKKLGDQNLERILHDLNSIAQISQAPPEPLALKRPHLQKRYERTQLISNLMTFIVMITGISMMQNHTLQPILLYIHALCYALPVASLLVFLNFRRLRHHVNAHYSFFAQLWLMLALWTSGFPGAIHALNRYLDHAPSQPAPSQILDKSSESYRGKTTYTLNLQNPLNPQAPLTWTVSEQAWNALPPQAPVQLQLRPGAFGYAWLEDVILTTK